MEEPFIHIAPYDPAWVQWFHHVAAYVWPSVHEVALRIDHVGSTSVPGLGAKPIVDMDVVVSDQLKVAPVISRLGELGYAWLGDLGVVGREAFQPPIDLQLPPHHLYLVVEDNKAHLDHWLLRDLLRADASSRLRYEQLKRENAIVAMGDLDVYTARKAGLVAELLTRARAQRGLPAAPYWVPSADELMPRRP